jgi:hypothetical protein
MKRLLIGLIPLLLGTTGCVSSADDTRPFSLGEGIVVDASRAAIYYADGQYALHKRATADGKLLWTSDKKGLPLAIVGGELLAHIAPEKNGVGRLQWIDIDSGKAGGALQVELPDEVTASIGPQANAHFEITPELSGGQIKLHWRYSIQPMRGALLSESDAQPMLRMGIITLNADAKGAQSRSVDTDSAPRKMLVLGAQEQLSNQVGRQFRSSDDRHVLASKAIDDPTFATRYRWSILERSGSKLGQIESIQSMAPFFATNNRLVIRATPFAHGTAEGMVEAHGERLVAYDLRTSAQVWSTPVIDPVFRGLLPP